MHRKELAKPQYPIWVNITERHLFPSVALIGPVAPPASPGGAITPLQRTNAHLRDQLPRKWFQKKRKLIHELLTGISFPSGPGNF